MIRVDKQSKRTTTKKKKKSNRINKSRVLKNIKNYQHQPKNIEREREREREGERNNFFFFFFVRENYTKNGRENNEFIVKWCE